MIDDARAERADLARSGRMPARVGVLGGFALSTGTDEVAPLTSGAQRLVAFLALHGRSISREQAAGVLFPDVNGRHAYASLRSTLARLDPHARHAVRSTATDLLLDDGVVVDLHRARALAHRILGRTDELRDADLDQTSVATLSTALLPGWYDEWVVVEAEDWRQLRLHALEALARRLVAVGRFGHATAAARAAIRAEPLRESAHGTLIAVHLAEGNQAEAVRQYEQYRTILLDGLGLEPTDRLRAQLPCIADGDRWAPRAGRTDVGHGAALPGLRGSG